eukprot:CAMPEP_0182866084 /NCGR_PEP_ID=MMETSP0034_2-20130328/8026_1 /TAXON_ID=156128 /ORGANISM="Nephroselmis pyriformis, Strain CCMP717" /LENGTH=165 /DNA_ID=CAMNT_0024998409 /DNA_START=36 /DNA_END=533 /DNA_ORIENTATION=-
MVRCHLHITLSSTAAVGKVATARAPTRRAFAVRAEAEASTTPVSTEKWEFVISKEALLKSPNQRASGNIAGAGQVAVFWFKNAPYATQGNCPHLGIPLAGGRVTDEGNLVCSQHKSSWKMETGEVEEWLPGNFINAVQRVLSPACPLQKFEAKVDADGMVYVKVP